MRFFALFMTINQVLSLMFSILSLISGSVGEIAVQSHTHDT